MKLRRILALLGIIVVLLLIAAGLCFTGVWIPNRPSRAEYPVRGIDISHHQGDIRWDTVAASGIRFAYIKATYGKTPLIYSSRDFRNRYLQGMVVDSWWVSDIILTPAQSPNSRWKFWQFTWRGKAPGVDGFVDLDVFSGRQNDFEAFATSPILPSR